MKLACQEQLIPGETLEEKWDLVAGFGFDGIELLGRGDGAFRDRLPELRRAREAGVVISSVCVAMDHFIGDFDERRRRDAIEQMKILLARDRRGRWCRVRSHRRRSRSGRTCSRPGNHPRTPNGPRDPGEALSELGEHAQREGSVVFFEPLNRYEDHMVNRLEQAAQICRDVASASVMVMADTFHMSIEEDDLAASVRSTGNLSATCSSATAGGCSPVSAISTGRR